MRTKAVLRTETVIELHGRIIFLSEQREKRRQRFRSHAYKLKNMQRKQGFELDEKYDRNAYKSGGFYEDFSKDEDNDNFMIDLNKNKQTNEPESDVDMQNL